MALRLYRRHTRTCKYKATPRQQSQRRCKCPIYVKGTLQRVPVRKSMGLTDWDAANAIMGEWTKAGVVGGIAIGTKTITSAVEDYLSDMADRGRASSSIQQNRLLLQTRLLAFCRSQNLVLLGDITGHHLSLFRASWNIAPPNVVGRRASRPLTLSSKCVAQTKLLSFFNFCRTNKKWITENPAHLLSSLNPPDPDVQPFSPEEIDRIMAACDQLPKRAQDRYDRSSRAKALILILRWTGLRIGDAATLKWSEVANGRLHRIAMKNHSVIRQKLATPIVEALFAPDGTRQRLGSSDTYVFWSGHSSKEAMMSTTYSFLNPVFALANVPNAHPHRFRHTFVVDAFLAKATLSSIAKAIGDKPETVEKYYKAWVDALQALMEEELSQIPGFSATTRPAPLPQVGPPAVASVECDSQSPL